ncbi:MAG: DUF805 domain-containing protein [Azonexus sp.]|jgi:uncharacterized membrane protein YhaH (DUF805 family)|nr:DUF805 domain-containing protein [Azonexus sp.]
MTDPDNPNPFAPPKAAVADVMPDGGEVFQPVRIFSAKGRMGRLRYLAYLNAGYFITSVTMRIAIMLLGKDLFIAQSISTVIGFLSLFVYTPYLILALLWGIQRSHDMNWSGWILLLPIALSALIYAVAITSASPMLIFLIPLISLIWLLRKGTPGPNRFGPPPPPNTTSVKVTAGIIITFFVLSVVIAISLPAYQQYKARSQAAQGQR